MFLDDVGVTVTMISVTLLAVIVVLLKIFIFSEQVKIKLFNIVHKNATTKLGWVTITTGYNELPNASPKTKKIHLPIATTNHHFHQPLPLGNPVFPIPYSHQIDP